MSFNEKQDTKPDFEQEKSIATGNVNGLLHRQPSYGDEKLSESADDKIHLEQLDSTQIGEVFDGPRLIDLGADGKERPISRLSSLYTTWHHSNQLR